MPLGFARLRRILPFFAFLCRSSPVLSGPCRASPVLAGPQRASAVFGGLRRSSPAWLPSPDFVLARPCSPGFTCLFRNLLLLAHTLLGFAVSPRLCLCLLDLTRLCPYLPMLFCSCPAWPSLLAFARISRTFLELTSGPSVLPIFAQDRPDPQVPRAARFCKWSSVLEGVVVSASNT